MTSVRECVLSAAVAWVRTPYVHQASAKGAGADCLGLLRGVWREVYGGEPEPVPPYTEDWSEPQREERLWSAASRHLQEIAPDRARPGDALLFRMRTGSVAKHLGILSREMPVAFVHSYTGHGVVESPLSLPWRHRLVAAFSFPELEP